MCELALKPQTRIEGRISGRYMLLQAAQGLEQAFQDWNKHDD
jgi:hypothetical protein